MQILGFLPGYMWDGSRLMSTGVALPPTQHVDHETGEIVYYCRPLFSGGATVGLYIKRSGLLKAVGQ